MATINNSVYRRVNNRIFRSLNNSSYILMQMELGERIERLMELRQLSQAELARRVGLTQPAIFAIIRRNKSGTKSLHKIARALHTTSEYLLGETDEVNGQLGLQFSPEEIRWVDSLRRLAQSDRSAILQVTDSLAKDTRREVPTLHSPKADYLAEDEKEWL